jgi:hypothetical protein
VSESRKLLDYWQPPEEAGAPLRCLATTFTYEPDFFQRQCLGRFLKMDTQYGEFDDNDNLPFVIEQEERLAEAPTTVIVDRSYGAEPRSLRWDVLPVGLRGGVQHAKVSLLAWEGIVRCIVASANLVERSYRSRVEAAVVLDAHEGVDLPRHLFDDLLSALRAIVGRAAGSGGNEGPKERALAALDFAGERIAEFELPERLPRSAPRIAVAASGPGDPALPKLRSVWRGARPRRARVLSPFFDTAQDGSDAAMALAGELAQRGRSEVTFVVPVDEFEARTLVRAPRALKDSLPDRVRPTFLRFDPGEADRGRGLHAKATLIESGDWVAALVGSSNFTAPGLGLGRSRANLEVNIAIGGSASHRAFVRGLRSLFPGGDALDLEAVDEWDPVDDEEEARGPELPWGFQEFLLEPGVPARLRIGVWPKELSKFPERWEVGHPDHGVLADSSRWKRARRRPELVVELPNDPPPFFVEVRWIGADGDWEAATWPVNVTDPGKLPPPAELRDLPASVLLAALASTRPLHEGLAAAIRRASRPEGTVELNPLKRFSATGRLLQRSREVAAALEGLTERLERPAASAEVLAWRVDGPVGPVALATALVGDTGEDRGLPGEASFLLAEIVLALSRIDWRATDKLLGAEVRRGLVRKALRRIRKIRRETEVDGLEVDPGLERYIARAFRRARA